MRIKPEQAVRGMYVQGFAGSWLSHPFWKADFIIRSDKELDRVRNGGTDVFIDPDKGVGLSPAEPAPAADAPPVRHRAISRITHAAPASLPPPRPAPPPPPRRVVAPQAFGKADKARATALAQRSTKVVKALFDDCRLGRAVETPLIMGVVGDIADLLENNNSAFTSVTRLKAKDDYTYTHSVAVCALLISLARETGASPQAVQDLGIAGLLHDIGKLRIDEALLKKTDALTSEERAQIARHPQLGHDMLSAEPGLPAVAFDVCLHHHERLDGSGYPFGLRDEAITPATRMAAICDVYDAMTSDRPYQKGKSPIDAITEMEGLEGHFDPKLLFLFMRSIGVFPAGKLLRLRSNRLALALPPVRQDCRPVVRTFYATVGSHFTDYDDVVLSDSLSDDQAVSQEDGDVWFSGDWPAMSERVMSGIALTRERAA